MANTIDKREFSELEEQDGDHWICLMDYATEYGVSLSTLRRHIKAGKIPHKIENGRYLLKSSLARSHDPVPSQRPAMPSNAPAQAAQRHQSPDPSHPSEVRELRLKLQRAQEEISELKMLVAIYEEQLAPKRPATPSPAQNQRVNGY